MYEMINENKKLIIDFPAEVIVIKSGEERIVNFDVLCCSYNYAVVSKITTEDGEIDNRVMVESPNTISSVGSYSIKVKSVNKPFKGNYVFSMDLTDMHGNAFCTKKFRIVVKEKHDISEAVTVFVITCGNNPNLEDCLNSIKNQSVWFKFELIKDYTPMSSAFQQMLERCKTKYFVQVDGDMILNEDAIEQMYYTIKNTETNVALYYFMLQDVHLNFNICGVKIYRHDIMSKYPYTNTLSCEMNQIQKMQKDGYIVSGCDKIAGFHSPKWTEEMIYIRYYDLMQKFKVYGYNWLETMPNKLYTMLMGNPTTNNFYAAMGAINGMMNDIKSTEKDFSVRSEDYLKMKSLTSTPDRATLFVTDKCNFKCNFCYRNFHDLDSFPDMKAETVKKLIERYPRIGGICICGYGEPLLCKNLESILYTLKCSKKVIGLITNGSLIKDKIEILKRYPPNYISISINAHNAKQHELEVGVPGQFNKILEGIYLLKGVTPTYLSAVCTKKNKDMIKEVIKLANYLGVDGLHLHNILPHHDITEENKKEFLDLVLDVNDKKIIDELKAESGSNIVKVWPILINPLEQSRNCMFPFVTISVDGNGSISVCNSIFPPRKENGNIDDLNLWHNQYCQGMRLMFSKKEMPLACKYCFRNWDKWTV